MDDAATTPAAEPVSTPEVTASPSTFPQILHDDLVALLARIATWEHAAAAAVQSDLEAAVAKLKALLTL